MNLKLKRTPGIYLVGFMASGKSTVGRHLARRLGWNFFDTDSEIEAAEKVTVAELFSSREVIRQHVRWIERGRPAVVALGGGAFVSPANRDLLENNGIAVWLDCPFEKVSQRVAAAGRGAVRPLASDAGRFAELYQIRRDSYSLADVRVTIETDDPEKVVDLILTDSVFR
jgi:shikimate kinase